MWAALARFPIPAEDEVSLVESSFDMGCLEGMRGGSMRGSELDVEWSAASRCTPTGNVSMLSSMIEQSLHKEEDDEDTDSIAAFLQAVPPPDAVQLHQNLDRHLESVLKVPYISAVVASTIQSDPAAIPFILLDFFSICDANLLVR